MVKTLIKLALSGIAVTLAGYFAFFYQNNRTADWPEPARIQAALDASIQWIHDHKDAALKADNPPLWWMIQRSAALTGHPVLEATFDEYRESRLEVGRNLWLPLFFPERWVPFKDTAVANFNDYKQHFIYAITCDAELARWPIVRAQMDPGYCDGHFFRPACATHQLIGFRMMQQNGCGDPLATQQAVAALQQRIRRQLTWDPRVVDVYIQRVLTLVESGAVSSVKPIWLQRILDAQHPDGGWGGIDPVLVLPAGKGVGFDARGFTFAKPESDFHATAQGIWLMSLLLTGEHHVEVSN